MKHLAVAVLGIVMTAMALVPDVAFSANTTATYYHHRFNGRRMANGKVYRPGRLTAAHRRYRLGTRIRVTNRRTGKSVRVTVTDRCNCTLDLSPAAFRKIGRLSQGRIPVKVNIGG
ncbi:hypothetical protein TI04_03565 [Achromatium sp. WMS2]|nr:hypothetical protein TI04_03565 [Achromatium sp. WMS2]